MFRSEVGLEHCFLASKNAVAEIRALKSENRGLWNALKKFFTTLFTKINNIYKTVSPDSAEGKYIADMRKAVKPIRDAFMEGAVAASKKTESTTKQTKSTDVKSKARTTDKYIDYDKPITTDDVEILRSIGPKSINDFTSEDIEKTQKWAYKFYQELGTKSPFFRAWFGDWRSEDKKTKRDTISILSLNVVSKNDAVAFIKQGLKDHSLFRGNVKNTDTDFNINIGSHAYNDTLTYANRELSRKNNITKYQDEISILAQIKKIASQSLLFDSSAINDEDNVHRTFMHYFYAICAVDNRPYLVKLGVDELNSDDNTTRRAYNVNNIEISPVAVSQLFRAAVTTGDGGEVISTYSISDLFSLVKQYDKDFSPKPVNPVLLNEDGTPKVFYHGTDAKFTEFSVDEIAAREGSFFFAENKMDAEAYGKNVFEVYLRGEKLADYDNQPSEFYKLKSKREQVEWLKGRGYDGWYADMDSDGWSELSVFSPEQIKSATNNIGTFDGSSKDIRHKARGVDKYTLKEYNSFGWVRANEVLTTDEYSNFTSEFSKATTSKAYDTYKSNLDEYMIPVGTLYGNKEGIKNKIVFAKGTIDNPEITRIIEINADNETDLTKIRSELYGAERQGIRSQNSGIFKVYSSTDYGYQSYQQRSGNGEIEDNLQLGTDRGAGSRTTPKVKEILFDDEGNEVSRTVRHKSRSYTAGQVAQVKANLSHNKVYSKKSAMELVSKIAPDIRNRSFEALSDQLWQGLNTYTSLDDKRQFAKDMAGIFIDRMMVDTLVKHSEWDKAVERMAYIKPAINSINLRDEDISELKYILDKDYPRLRGRWGYKTPSNGEFKRP